MDTKYIRNSFRLLYGMLLLTVIYSCANIGSPNGGPYDETPPKFVSSTPVPNQINYTGKRNEFRIYLVSIYVYFKYIRQTRAKIGKNPVKISRVIPPEKNTIVTTFYNAGITVRHAGDSQALIQLKREYCNREKSGEN